MEEHEEYFRIGDELFFPKAKFNSLGVVVYVGENRPKMIPRQIYDKCVVLVEFKVGQFTNTVIYGYHKFLARCKKENTVINYTKQNRDKIEIWQSLKKDK